MGSSSKTIVIQMNWLGMLAGLVGSLCGCVLGEEAPPRRMVVYAAPSTQRVPRDPDIRWDTCWAGPCTWPEDKRLDREPPREDKGPGKLLARHREEARKGALSDRPGTMLMTLRRFSHRGGERWARAAMEMILPYARGEAPLGFYQMSAVDFWTHSFTAMWDAVEEFPWFTDEERLLVANFI